MYRYILKLIRKSIKILNILYAKIASLSEKDIPKNISSFQIAKKGEIGKVLFTAKPKTTEHILLMNIFNTIHEGSIKLEYPEQNFMEYSGALFFPSSDFIITENKAVWDKFYYPSYTKLIPLDKELEKVEDDQLYINTLKEVVEFKKAFSLCGVHATVWSHFLVQYLPKLYYSKDVAGFYDEEITFIIPEYSDKNIVEVISMFSDTVTNVNYYVLQNHQAALCEKLIYIENTSIISDHEYYMTYLDVLIPDKVATVLKNNLVFPLKKKLDLNESIPTNKLYIVRNNTNYRRLKNVEEIETFFREEGFIFVEPHKLSLDEKVELFHNAKLVVGPYSSGFSNVLFCQPDTKILAFMNTQRCFESYLTFYIKHFNLNFMSVTGTDEKSEDSHSDFTIPLDRVKNALLGLV